MGQYPVIFLSLKSAKQPSYKAAYEKTRDAIIYEYFRHRYLLEGENLAPAQKNDYLAFMEKTASPEEYATSLQFLSQCLEQYHKQKTIILIDEYDVPLENSYFRGFYNEMADFVRSLFESALKTNTSLGFAVVTGCLRISRESIFTGLNNFEVISVLDENYSEHFGFIQSEVDNMFSFYGLQDKTEEARLWYDGYIFGKTEVYNPWSIIKYVKDIVYGNTDFPKQYWSNTSSNSIVHDLIENADDITKDEIEKLACGGTIEKPVHEDITYGDIYESQDNLWNFLFFTGYLKAVDRYFESDSVYLVLKIPNREIRYIYNNHIKNWM